MKRRVLISAIAAALVALMAGPASAIPKPPIPIVIEPDGYGGCYLLQSKHQYPLGRAFDYVNDDDVTRTVTEEHGFWSYKVAPGGSSDGPYVDAAGTYDHRCYAEGGYQALGMRLDVPSSPGNPSFKVRWADKQAPSSFTYDVQYRIGTTDTFQYLKRGTSSRSLMFDGQSGTTYQFRARTTLNGQSTGWSPISTATVG